MSYSFGIALCRLLSLPSQLFGCSGCSVLLPELEGWVQSSFPRGPAEIGGPVWPHLMSGAQFPAHCPRALCVRHSPLFTTAPGWGQDTTSLCTPLINLPRYTGILIGSRSCPQTSLLVDRPAACAQGLFPKYLSSPFEKKPLWELPLHLQAMPGFPHTPTC